MIARALAVKLADIGDVLTATPALAALRETYPAARVDLLTTPRAAAVVPGDLVDRILIAPRALVARPRDVVALGRLALALRSNRYDTVLVLHHLTLRSGALKYRLLAALTGAAVVVGLDNGKGRWLTHPVPDRGFGACHEVEYGLQVAARVGARASDTRLAARCGPEDITFADRLLHGLDGGRRVAIHPGSGGYAPARRWPVERWAAVADELAGKYDARIVLVGGPTDGTAQVKAGMHAAGLDLGGRTTLPQLAAVLARCDLFLGADSGVMHLAAASGVPVVALFGPSNHLAWAPWTPGGRSVVVRAGLACSPCSYVGHSVGNRAGCAECRCMTELSTDQVLAAVRDLMGWAEAS